MRRRGVLITLEGNEGCGKSTQIKLLKKYFLRRGRKVYVTREPGGTKIGDAIRAILLDYRHEEITPDAETLLYMAARSQLVKEVIAPRLKQGYVVLCDRWLDATIAYQGYGAGVDRRWIQDLGRRATQGVVPAISLFLELPLLCGLKRAKRRKAADRMERKKIRFHQKVRRGYLAILKADAKRFKAVKIAQKDSIQCVHEKIKGMLTHVIG